MINVAAKIIMSYFFLVHVPMNHHSEAFNNNIQKLYFITPYIKALKTSTKCDSITLTRQNLEAAVLFSKNDRLLVLYRCLCGRSTEQVPAGVLDPCGILTVNNINNNNNNNNNKY